MRLRSSRTIVSKSSSVSRRNDAAQVVVEVRRFGLNGRQLAKIEPLAGEILDERVGLAVGEHPLHLLLQRRRVAQPALGRQVEQLVVRNAAPQEEREARGELDVADAIDAPAGNAAGSSSIRYRNRGATSRRASACWMPRLEVAGCAALLDRTSSSVSTSAVPPARDRRAARASSGSSARMPSLQSALAGLQTEDRAAARRVARARRVERAR